MSGKLSELNDIIRVVTGLSIEDVATLPHDEQIRRIDAHVQPRDIFKEAVEEMMRDKGKP